MKARLLPVTEALAGLAGTAMAIAVREAARLVARFAPRLLRWLRLQRSRVCYGIYRWWWSYIDKDWFP